MMASTSLREASNYGDRPNVDRYQGGREQRFGCVGVGLASPVLRDQRPAIVLITGALGRQADRQRIPELVNGGASPPGSVRAAMRCVRWASVAKDGTSGGMEIADVVIAVSCGYREWLPATRYDRLTRIGLQDSQDN